MTPDVFLQVVRPPELFPADVTLMRFPSGVDCHVRFQSRPVHEDFPAVCVGTWRETVDLPHVGGQNLLAGESFATHRADVGLLLRREAWGSVCQLLGDLLGRFACVGFQASGWLVLVAFSCRSTFRQRVHSSIRIPQHRLVFPRDCSSLGRHQTPASLPAAAPPSLEVLVSPQGSSLIPWLLLTENLLIFLLLLHLLILLLPLLFLIFTPMLLMKLYSVEL